MLRADESIYRFEQQANGRLMRPGSAYIGEQGRQWVALEQRS